MGRRVLACGEAVATTTSDHVARSILPDMRWMGTTAVPRKNYIESEHLSLNKTTNTKFDGGWVWKQDTKCGFPPPSKAQPDDHLVGVKCGIVDGWAEAFDGQGAATVYVEGKKAIRKDDLTYQNHKNTIGIIKNAEEIAAWLAEPVPPSGDDQSAGRVPTDTLTTTTGEAGEDEATRNKDDEGNNVTTTNDATPDCTLEKFELIDDGKRKSSPQHVLEVIEDSKVKAVATGKFCEQHAEINFGGYLGKNELERTMKADNVAQIALLHKWWKEVRVTADAHGKQITGRVIVCSKTKWSLEIGAPPAIANSMVAERGRNYVSRKVLDLRAKIKPQFKLLESKLPCKLPWADFKYLEGTIVVGAAWKEQSNWRALCEYSAGGKVLIVDAFFKKEFFFFDWVRTCGPVGLVIYGIKEAMEWIFECDLSFLKLEIKLGGKLEVEGSGFMGVDRDGKISSGGIELKGSAEIYLSLTLKLAFTSAIDGSAGGKGSVGLELSGRFNSYPSGSVTVKLSFKGVTVTVNIGLKVKLGWFGRLIPSWVSAKIKAACGAEIKDGALTFSKEWKLLDGWGKFDIINEEFALPA